MSFIGNILGVCLKSKVKLLFSCIKPVLTPVNAVIYSSVEFDFSLLIDAGFEAVSLDQVVA